LYDARSLEIILPCTGKIANRAATVRLRICICSRRRERLR